jgi:Uma2 family endonuclease
VDDYALAGVSEYWIINPILRTIEIYELRGSEYVLLQTASAGSISPQDFPGVTIDVEPLWAAWGGSEPPR